MSDAYENALRTIADAYEAEIARCGEGKSLARIATIAVSSGSFFQRLREGKPFLVHNLEKIAAYFRDARNWPAGAIPHPASAALIGIGRPPHSELTHSYASSRPAVACDPATISQRGAA